MNRFLLFACEQYYPLGGMDDCVLMSNDKQEILEKWRKLTADYSHVYDCETGRVYETVDSFSARFG